MTGTRAVRVGAVTIGGGGPLAVIGGPCAIENEKHALMVAERLQRITADAGVPFIYKSSYDKANRSSGQSFRGLGMDNGLEILAEVRKAVGVPVLTDVHEMADVPAVAATVDVLQTPAFLCRQTDFIRAVASAGRPVNIKKGQFLAPGDMKNVVDKAREAARAAHPGDPEAADNLLVCERGASFGYNNLVSDMRSLAIMRETGCPVVFDATHSVQLPGGAGERSGGERQYVPALARAAVAFGIDALFMEMHEDPDRTLPDGRPLSDGPNMLRIDDLPRLLQQLQAIESAVRP
jgi:2-dehydro-3-deoxyphosphooctonate aldolase (KDO 8-P synthase)